MAVLSQNLCSIKNGFPSVLVVMLACLSEIAIYTLNEELPLKDVFSKIFEKEKVPEQARVQKPPKTI